MSMKLTMELQETCITCFLWLEREVMMGVKICLDAGHYGKYNQSPANGKYYESDMVWKLHLFQKQFLEEYGIEVITTRANQETDKGLYDRGALSAECNLFISDHSNAVGNSINESVDYPVAYVLLNGSSTDIGLKLAKEIQRVMGTSQDARTATRQGTNGEYYGVLRGAAAVGTPGIILEHSFHTNSRITNWLLNDDNLKALAKAEAEIIAEYFGVKKSNSTSGYCRIMGNAVADIEQMQVYLKEKNPGVAQSVLDMIPLYLSEGQAEGVRGDIAFAQGCLETENFGFSQSAVTLEQNNFAGMGVTQNGMKGLSFATQQLGIRCQIQHLKAYASTETLEKDNIDPRFKYVTRGSAEHVEWLGIQENPQGKGWAAGAGYGAKILAILKNIIGNSGAAIFNNSGQNVNPISGYVRVIYKGSDGLNIRTSPSMGDNVDQVIHEGKFTVVGISEDKNWYQLKSGLFITTGKQYVEYLENMPETNRDSAAPFKVKVGITDLNIRTGAGTNYAVTGHKTGIGVFTIMEVKSGVGSAGGWGRLKSGAGWIALDYATRI